jgi:hypothetical protein
LQCVRATLKKSINLEAHYFEENFRNTKTLAI